MNSITWIITFCAVVLFGAFAYSLVNVKKGSPASLGEKEKLRQELNLLKQMSIVDVQPAPSSDEVDKQREMDALKAEIEALKDKQMKAQELELTQMEAEQQVEEVEIEIPEPVMDPNDERRLQRRVKLITSALIMAQVEQFHPSDGFATIHVINYENVQSGVTLAIRRNTGIIGQLTVSTVEGEKAIADVLAYSFIGGEVDVQPGDELIIPPL